MNLPLILNLLVFVALLLGLAQTRRTNWSLAKKVLFALVLGVIFGVVLHAIYGAGNPVLKASIGWFTPSIMPDCPTGPPPAPKHLP